MRRKFPEKDKSENPNMELFKFERNQLGLCSLTLTLFLTIFGSQGLRTVRSAPQQQFPFSYTNVGGAIKIISFGLGDGEVLQIPDEISGIPITTIGSNPTLQFLPDLRIPATVTNIEPQAFGDGFFSSVGSFEVSANNPAFTSEEGVLFSKDKSILIRFPSNRAGEYVIPMGVKTISDGAFGESQLTSVIISEGVAHIGRNAFQGSDGLRAVVIPATVSFIDAGAFDLSFGVFEPTGPGGPLPPPNMLFFRGNAPATSGYVGWYRTIAYYVPGTSGWEGWQDSNIPPRDDRSNTIVRPWPLLSAVRSSRPSGGEEISLIIEGAPGDVLVLEANESLANSSWEVISTLELDSEKRVFIDPDAAKHSRRFYRLRGL